MADRPATTSKNAKRKPGRKRRVAGRVLLVIGVLITGVWGASRWWRFGYGGDSRGVWVSAGIAESMSVEPGLFRAWPKGPFLHHDMPHLEWVTHYTSLDVDTFYQATDM